MMDHTHISSAFDRDLEGIQAMIMKMGGMVEHSIDQAFTAFVDNDLERVKAVRAGDKDIDALEEAVNEAAARVIALRAPTAGDLRTVLSVFRISSHLERIGDYAKNVAKRVVLLDDHVTVQGAPQAIQRMSREVEAMLRDVLDAYIQRDVALAHSVRDRDADVDRIYNTLFREYLTHMMEDPRNITGCMHLHFMAKNVERMGDHVTAIAEQVIYIVTGEMPDEDRQKGNRLPQTPVVE